MNNRLITSSGTSLEDFETIGSFNLTGAGASIVADTTNFKEGTQGLAFSVVNGVSSNITKVISLDLSATTNFKIWVYIADPTNLDYLHFYFTSVADWSKYFEFKDIRAGDCKTGWNCFAFDPDHFANTGGESWVNTMVRFMIRITPKAATAISMTFDDWRIDCEAIPIVFLFFDDGYESDITKAYPILQANDQAAVSFVIQNKVGIGGRMTLSQLTTLYNAGWDISNHSKTHPHLNVLTAAQLDDEVNGMHEYLVDNGFTKSANFLAYTYGEYNSTIITKTKENHMMARAIRNGSYPYHVGLNEDDREYLITCEVAGAGYKTVGELETFIDHIIETKGCFGILYHDIVDAGAAGTQCLTADLQSVSDYLKTKEDAGLLQVMTLYEYLGYIAAVGEARIEFSSRSPSITFASRQPSVVFT